MPAINYVKKNIMTPYLPRWGSSAGFEPWVLVKENMSGITTNIDCHQYKHWLSSTYCGLHRCRHYSDAKLKACKGMKLCSLLSDSNRNTYLSHQWIKGKCFVTSCLVTNSNKYLLGHWRATQALLGYLFFFRNIEPELLIQSYWYWETCQSNMEPNITPYNIWHGSQYIIFHTA